VVTWLMGPDFLAERAGLIGPIGTNRARLRFQPTRCSRIHACGLPLR
jgi:hypothetical protein